MKRNMTVACAAVIFIATSGCGGEIHKSHSVVAAASEHCSSVNVFDIERPYYANSATPTFNFKYEFVKGTDASLPVVVFLTGGPGQTAIGDPIPGLSNQYGYMNFDPRGVGCNELATMPKIDFFRTDNLSNDVLAALKASNVTNYILYGLSYGTSLATVVAGKAENGIYARPKALVLEGVLGRSFKDTGELYDGYFSNWDYAKATLPEAALARLNSENTPLGIGGGEWGDAIGSMLMIGTSPGQGYIPTTWLSELASNTSSDDAALKSIVGYLTGSAADSPGTTNLYRGITCRELTDVVVSMKSDFILKSGSLLLADGDVCGDLRLGNDKYDAAKWPTSSPIYYFSGGRDPATPPWQAQYHFDVQLQAQRHLVRIPTAGHNPFQINLSDCLSKIWNDIATEQSIDNDVRAC
ncbi:MAG: alpha/beta hydrolase, partial [Proteobacteria bacterium]|nr:alpha/beta hydrolase [Pseudomonadota bacterium]